MKSKRVAFKKWLEDAAFAFSMQGWPLEEWKAMQLELKSAYRRGENPFDAIFRITSGQ